MEEREFNYLILSGKQKKNKQTKTTEGRIWLAPLHRANEIIHVLCDKWPQKKQVQSPVFSSSLLWLTGIGSMYEESRQ